ncbi:unnamed protein product [Medioppia subpectinata]|uniref:Uncharacterized protein n=1 Tax=Medioppia subpectinata TaxID=1979941 RepID=A0A7R9L8L3_9ACAR|nr:unnamed protein product [Medioppia subpectinata]CAG2116893.1 unnamed protein product [Medioppia subpectinata]
MRLIIMFNVCKQSHTTYSQLKSVYTRLGSCCLTTSGRLLSPKSPQSHPNRRLLTTKAKREDNDHHLSDKQIDQLNGSNNLLLHCPKWDHMYDVFYGSRQSQHIDPKTHIKTTFDINSNDGNKETNLLDTSHEWKPVDRLNAKTLIKYYTQLAKLRLTVW